MGWLLPKSLNGFLLLGLGFLAGPLLLADREVHAEPTERPPMLDAHPGGHPPWRRAGRR